MHSKRCISEILKCLKLNRKNRNFKDLILNSFRDENIQQKGDPPLIPILKGTTLYRASKKRLVSGHLIWKNSR